MPLDEQPLANSRPESQAELSRTTATVTSRIELPTSTIVKVLLTLLIIWLIFQLWQVILLVLIAFLVATALSPLVAWLQRRRWPRGAAVGTVFAGLIGIIALILTILIPPLVEQAQQFIANLPGYIEVGEEFLEGYPEVFDRLEDAALAIAADPSALFAGFLAVGVGLIAAIFNVVIVLALAVYILIDGERIYDWIARYLSPGQRVKVRRAMPEVSKVLSGYVAGQSINSLLAGGFSYIVLSLLGVPEPLLLAVIVAVTDAIPIAGVLIYTTPAVLLALTVSVEAAVIVFILYIAYNQIENYIIIPRVYRSTLKVSSFAVLLGVLIGGSLLGIIGIILSLPITATIPVIERVWRGTDVEPGPPGTGSDLMTEEPPVLAPPG